ncbi:hypothetical protein FHS19_001592 [Paenibacillus rhizosphaerae]|uniref:Uncharacterized protein n=1 Tax=Paenibacillus rhizosphaerae TaxID=297318 RepID=A0A839TNE2_9BACL|nr:hypothetical protein [Paenibacillus rhizosphaerae]MBB3126938.1 hypothetical protein [Paenibacillus rhizosphaerae]
MIKEERDPHQREEDFAAACCLMQNFRLLAQENMLHVRMTMNDWIYDQNSIRRYGVHKDERVVAVLEMGYLEPTEEPVTPADSPNSHFELLKAHNKALINGVHHAKPIKSDNGRHTALDNTLRKKELSFHH